MNGADAGQSEHFPCGRNSAVWNKARQNKRLTLMVIHITDQVLERVFVIDRLD
jgi:hypothetical protein